MERFRSNKVRVIHAYDNQIVKAYCTVRFLIMNMRILEEIGQYLPKSGRILDVGCGFGLFTLYYALESKDRHFTSLDIDKKRILMAQKAAESLNIRNQVSFITCPAQEIERMEDSFSGAYMLDLLHHLPQGCLRRLLTNLHRLLDKGGILIVKDIATSPRWKKWFTGLADLAIWPSMPPHYVDVQTLCYELERVGFDVKIHTLLDILPYPHVMYICRKL